MENLKYNPHRVKSEREKANIMYECVCRESRKMVLMNTHRVGTEMYTENGLVDTMREGEGGTNSESSVDT